MPYPTKHKNPHLPKHHTATNSNFDVSKVKFNLSSNSITTFTPSAPVQVPTQAKPPLKSTKNDKVAPKNTLKQKHNPDDDFEARPAKKIKF